MMIRISLRFDHDHGADDHDDDHDYDHGAEDHDDDHDDDHDTVMRTMFILYRSDKHHHHHQNNDD